MIEIIILFKACLNTFALLSSSSTQLQTKIVDLYSGKPLWTNQLDNISSINELKSNKELISEGSFAHILDIKTGKQIQTLKEENTITCAAISNNRLYSLIGKIDGQVSLRSNQDGTLLHRFDLGNLKINSVSFNEKDKLILIAAKEQLHIQDMHSFKLIREWNEHILDILTAKFSGSKIMTTSHDGTAKVFDLRSRNSILSFEDHMGPVNDIIFNEKDHQQQTACDDTFIRVQNEYGQLISKLDGHKGPVKSLELNNDNSLLITADNAIKVVIYKVSTFEITHEIQYEYDSDIKIDIVKLFQINDKENKFT